jgi:hypothetical protein
VKAHPEYVHLREEGPMDVFVVGSKAKNICEWMQLIIGGRLPFSTCENEHYVKLTKRDPISTKTFMTYMEKLCVKFEDKITRMLPALFAVVFDGWSEAGTILLVLQLFLTIPAEAMRNFCLDLPP